jgi:hypothetical protein
MLLLLGPAVLRVHRVVGLYEPLRMASYFLGRPPQQIDLFFNFGTL